MFQFAVLKLAAVVKFSIHICLALIHLFTQFWIAAILQYIQMHIFELIWIFCGTELLWCQKMSSQSVDALVLLLTIAPHLGSGNNYVPNYCYTSLLQFRTFISQWVLVRMNNLLQYCNVISSTYNFKSKKYYLNLNRLFLWSFYTFFK